MVHGARKAEKVIWVLDSGASRHMTEERYLLTEVIEKTGPLVTFGDNSKGKTMGHGYLKVGNVIIENVSLVDGLKRNLLSISKFYDKGFSIHFEKETCLINHIKGPSCSTWCKKR